MPLAASVPWLFVNGAGTTHNPFPKRKDMSVTRRPIWGKCAMQPSFPDFSVLEEHAN